MEGWTDKVNRQVYVNVNNGAVSTRSYAGGASDTGYPLTLGAYSNGTVGLNGRLDEAALYKRVLTASERTWLYNNGQGRSYADIVGAVQYHAVTGAVTDTGYVCPQGEVCDLDQAQTGVNNSYGYDANGNQTTRTINGVTLTLAYDAEGRLVSVTGPSITASFTYDGDGKRVKSTINGETTVFVGNHYEVQGSTVTKYYYAGSTRVAIKVGSAVYYLLSDHLGSTSLTTDAGGSVTSELKYGAWGNVRCSSGSTPTNYTYTGQYSNVPEFGLLFYNARWYDPYLNHFTQPDTIVSDLYNSQDWDRYSYARNNPLKYTDPSGHKACNGPDANACATFLMPEKSIRLLLKLFGVRLENGSDKWTVRTATAAYWAVYDIGSKLGIIHGNSAEEAFRNAFNTSNDNALVFRKVSSYLYQGKRYEGGAVTQNSHLIEFAWINYIRQESIRNNVVHELGHAFSAGHGNVPQDEIPSGYQENYVRDRAQILMPNVTILWQLHIDNQSRSETFADMFVAWTYNQWQGNLLAQNAGQWMNIGMSTW